MTETITLQPAMRIRGVPVLPGDKSISHRALIFAACAQGRCRIENLATGEDIRSTTRALRALGIQITLAPDGESAIVEGRGGKLEAPDGPIDCGNSGTTMRLIAGLLAAQPLEVVLTGDESLSRRPMDQVTLALVRMGAEIETGPDHRPPLKIKGGDLRGISFRPEVASAQSKSAVIIAGLFAVGDTVIHEPLPTRDHTERLLGKLGVQNLIDVDRMSRSITVYGGRLPLRSFDLVVPGDSSSAAYPIALGCILPESSVTTPFVSLNPGRIAFYRHLQAMGAHLVLTPDAQALQATGGEPVGDITVHSAKLRNIPIAPERIPAMIDELPLLAVISCIADHRWEIRHAERLRVKESDRISTTVAMLRAIGADVEEFDDGLGGPGGQKLTGGKVDCAGDHRIVMAASVGAWCSKGRSELSGSESVKISFPGFFKIMDDLVEHS